jgi:hypothetical protein
MTPLQFAKAQCANFDKVTGACKGIGIHHDGSLSSFGGKPACVLADRTARCAYFEECVLPMHFDRSTAAGMIHAESHQEAVNAYAAGTQGTRKAKHPICPHCRKREIEPPKRFCYQCAVDRKKASDLKAQRRLRHVRKTPYRTPANIGPNWGVQKVLV